MRPSQRLELEASQTEAAQPTTEITIKLTPFDRKEYRALIEAREQTLRSVVKRLKPALGLSAAVDAGCGVGFFSQTLAECGLHTCGFDARAENIEEARRRFPGIPFEQADVETREISRLGQFDLVLCFGLLYHLENPWQAIRNLRAITEKCLVLESMCLPEGRCSLLLRQEPRQDDQSLTEMACYPSESTLVKMLYRAGFARSIALRLCQTTTTSARLANTGSAAPFWSPLVFQLMLLDSGCFSNPRKRKTRGRRMFHPGRYLSVFAGFWQALRAASTSHLQIVHGAFSPICQFPCACLVECGGWPKKAFWIRNFSSANSKRWNEHS